MVFKERGLNMQYDIQNKQALTYEMVVNGDIEYNNQMSNMKEEDGDMEKILKEIAILKQQIAVVNSEILALQTDVKKNSQDIKELKE